MILGEKDKMYVISELLQGCSNAKIIEVILENYNEELDIPDVARMAGTSEPDTKDYLRHLESKGIVKEIRFDICLGPIFKFNHQNPISKALILLEHQIVATGLEKAIKEYSD